MNPNLRETLNRDGYNWMKVPKYDGFFRVTYKGNVRWIQCGEVKRAIEFSAENGGRYTTLVFQDGTMCSVDQTADEVMALAFGK